MLNAAVSAALQNVHEPGDIRVDVGMGILPRITDSSLSRQMHNPLWLLFPKYFLDGWRLGHIGFEKTEVLTGLQSLKAGLFETDIVIIIQIIDAKTSSPRPISRFATCEPINLAAPVTRIFICSRSALEKNFHNFYKRPCLDS